MGIPNFKRFYDNFIHFGKKYSLLNPWWKYEKQFTSAPIVLYLDSIAILYPLLILHLNKCDEEIKNVAKEEKKEDDDDDDDDDDDEAKVEENTNLRNFEDQLFTKNVLEDIGRIAVKKLMSLLPTWVKIHEIVIFSDGLAPVAKFNTVQKRLKTGRFISRKLRHKCAQVFTGILIKQVNYKVTYKYPQCYGEGEWLCVQRARRESKIHTNVVILGNDYDIMLGLLMSQTTYDLYTIKMDLSRQNVETNNHSCIKRNKLAKEGDAATATANEDDDGAQSKIFKWPKSLEIKNRLLLYFLFNFVSNDYVTGVKSGTDEQYRHIGRFYTTITTNALWKNNLSLNVMGSNIFNNIYHEKKFSVKYLQWYHFFIQLMYGFVFFQLSEDSDTVVDEFFIFWSQFENLNTPPPFILDFDDLKYIEFIIIQNLWYLGYVTFDRHPPTSPNDNYIFNHIYNGVINKSPLFWNDERLKAGDNLKQKINQFFNTPSPSILFGEYKFPNYLSCLIYKYFYNLADMNQDW